MHHSIINNNKQVQCSCHMSPKQISLQNELDDTKLYSMILFGFDFCDYDREHSGSAIVDTFQYCSV